MSLLGSPVEGQALYTTPMPNPTPLAASAAKPETSTRHKKTHGTGAREAKTPSGVPHLGGGCLLSGSSGDTLLRSWRLLPICFLCWSSLCLCRCFLDAWRRRSKATVRGVHGDGRSTWRGKVRGCMRSWARFDKLVKIKPCNPYPAKILGNLSKSNLSE